MIDNKKKSVMPLFDPDAHTLDEYKEFERQFWYDLKQKYNLLKCVKQMGDRDFEPLTKPWFYVPIVFAVGFVIGIIVFLVAII